jgi:hypothetical protein
MRLSLFAAFALAMSPSLVLGCEVQMAAQKVCAHTAARAAAESPTIETHAHEPAAHRNAADTSSTREHCGDHAASLNSEAAGQQTPAPQQAPCTCKCSSNDAPASMPATHSVALVQAELDIPGTVALPLPTRLVSRAWSEPPQLHSQPQDSSLAARAPPQ